MGKGQIIFYLGYNLIFSQSKGCQVFNAAGKHPSKDEKTTGVLERLMKLSFEQ